MLLRFEGLGFGRRGEPLFDGVSGSVAAGGVLKITGGNGRGKTTLIKILCGLLLPDSGAVYWRGDDVAADDEAFRAAVLYVGHRNALAADLTPPENLHACALLRTLPPVRGFGDALRRAGLGAAVHRRRCGVLSAGQRRRAALARLQAFAATLWLLDEPLAGLDAAGKIMLSDWLAQHRAGGGGAVVTMHSGGDWDIPGAAEVAC